MRGARTLAIALATTAALPAAAGAASTQTSVYTVAKASGSEKVTFSSDSANCARFLTCGHHGTVSYKFGGRPHGKLVLKRDRRGHMKGKASFRTSGTTTAVLTGNADCQDTVTHSSDSFVMTSNSRLGKLMFQLHGGKTDYLATGCATPSEVSLKADRGLPEGAFKRSDFGNSHVSFRLSGSSSFREKGFRGTAEWSLTYRLSRQGCSPNCRAGLPG